MKYFMILVQTVVLLWPGHVGVQAASPISKVWEFQSIDTMKYSRDVAREKLTDKTFDQTIDTQVKNIAQTGATHIALGTPYDEEFVPYLARWVAAGRKYKLHVWFRGNWSGWEGWFGYSPITRAQHRQKTDSFILTHSDLFADGDVFSACPECENGGPGDPRQIGDVAGYRHFLISEYQTSQTAFAKIGKRVISNYFSMNGDVARLVMDKDTTAQLGGIVVIDHYVATPERLAQDIQQIASQSGGQVVLGEFGAPIPDIHGPMTPTQQADWLTHSLALMVTNPSLVGLNYWTNTGSSTGLWQENGQAKPAVAALAAYYSPQQVTLKVSNELNLPVSGGQVSYLGRDYTLSASGLVTLPVMPHQDLVTVTVASYKPQLVNISPNSTEVKVTLAKIDESWWFKLLKWLAKL